MNAKPNDANELLRLCGLLVDEQLDEADAQRLSELLAADAQARTFYRSYMDAHARLLLHHEPVPVVSQTAEEPRDPVVAGRGPLHTRRPTAIWRWLVPLAAAACLLLAFGVWRFWPGDGAPPIAGEDPRPPVVPEDPPLPGREDAPVDPPRMQVVGPWQITPTGDPDFQVVGPMLVRLDRGELLVESTDEDASPSSGGAEASLRVKTPHGEASATGTRFYVGTHRPTEREGSTMSSPLTRVLVLSGVVTLTTALGSVEGGPGDLLAAEPDKAPAKIAVQANSDFAFDLYKQLAKENEGENLFFSPYSFSGALAMTAEGARHETAAEMGKALRFPGAAKHVGDDAQQIPWETSLIHTGMAELNKRLMGDKDPAETAAIRARIAELRTQLAAEKAKSQQLMKDRKWQEAQAAQQREREIAANLNKLSAQIDQYEIRVANALWGEKTYPFDPEYVQTIHDYYETGGIFPADFKNNFEGERLRINGWVEEQTNERIRNLIPAGALGELTRLVLTNAIYFKGEWSTPFKEANTKDRDFTLADGDKVQTSIMHAPKLKVARYGVFNADGSHFNTPMRIRRGQDPKQLYPKADGFAMVELPYKGDDLSMVVIAPNAAAGLPAVEKQLTPENLNRWIGQLEKRETHVYLPKFKMETDYELSGGGGPGTLQKMGMVRAFKNPSDPNSGAQFQGMTTSTNPADQLYFSLVIHKAFVEVNEKGTEAAAATAVAMLGGGGSANFIPEFRADRPFLFLIRDKVTGSILFLGRMTSPPAIT